MVVVVLCVCARAFEFVDSLLLGRTLWNMNAAIVYTTLPAERWYHDGNVRTRSTDESLAFYIKIASSRLLPGMAPKLFSRGAGLAVVLSMVRTIAWVI